MSDINYKSKFVFIWEEFEGSGFVYPNAKLPIKRLFQEADFDIKNLKAENKKLREALELYADPNNWDNVNYPNMCIIEGDCKEVVHKNTECAGGEIARQTLKELEGEK